MPLQIFGSNVANTFVIINNTNTGGININSNPIATSSEGLYDFTSFTFTNATATGRNGPTYAQMLAAYTSSATWASNTSYFTSSIRGIQNWTVPQTAQYRITAAGAKGGDSPSVSLSGGLGAIIVTDVSLTQGQVVSIVVGQSGSNRSTNSTLNGGSGGGGTFLYDSSSITYYIAVGGGGGAAGTTTALYSNQLTASGKFNTTSGSTVRVGTRSLVPLVYFTASGGTNGSGGFRSDRNILFGGPGAGISSDGFSSNNTQGLSRLSNWLGGSTGSTSNANAREGGFGGGGGAGDGDASADFNTIGWAGGGGGYSGGGAGGNSGESNSSYGGGGGTYYIGSFVSGASNWNNGHGYVTITKL